MSTTKEVRMSPVVPVGLGAIDAALIAQTIYAVRDLSKKKEDHNRK
jgi:Arc/MetJ family transcription regulator